MQKIDTVPKDVTKAGVVHCYVSYFKDTGSWDNIQYYFLFAHMSQ